MATLTVAGETRAWEEGRFLVFDDSVLHTAANAHPTEPRVVLHIAFPTQPTQQPGPPLQVPGLAAFHGPSASPVVATIAAPGLFSVAVYANCSAQTTLVDGRKSVLQPLMLLYNKVSDNRPQNSEPCIAVAPASVVAGVADPSLLRVVAAHGYGTLDLRYTIGTAWVTFELAAIADWKADPTEKHIQFARLDTGILDPAKAPFTSGKFQGYRGTEGLEEWSAGFLTLSSEWQQYNTFFYAKQGQKLGFTCSKTAVLNTVIAELGKATGLPPPNANRAKTWYWTNPIFTSEATMDTVIARAKSFGVKLIFFMQMTSNLGDFTADPTRFPSGFAATADKVRAAGFQVGLHLISPGASRVGTKVAQEHKEYFVPQGFTTRDYYGKTDAGTWWSHEGKGNWAWDHTRASDSNLPPSEQPPPGNAIQLVNVGWSKLGRYRNGSALGFDGTTSYGQLKHVSEYNFTTNFSLQMVVHAAAPVRGEPQTLAAKQGAWHLAINAAGKLEFHVNFASGGWVAVTGTTILTPDDPTHTVGGPWVVKATVGNGKVGLHLCPVVTENIGTAANPVMARNRCHMDTEATSTAASKTPLLAQSTASITVGAGSASPLLGVGVGSAVRDQIHMSAAPTAAFFSGAIEEIMLSKVDTTSWEMFNWNCPATGMLDYYIFDYTNPAARQYWANSTSALFNMAHATASQWDGAEFQPSTAGWDIPHSNQTFNSGLYTLSQMDWHPLWGGSSLRAFQESHDLWNQPLAVEMSLLAPGFAPWRGDMSPFSDEQRLLPSRGGDGMCVGGEEWVGQILFKTHTVGTFFNSYLTDIPTLPNATWADCFLGALVAAGIPPQMCDASVYPPRQTPEAVARDASITYWIGKANELGHSTEHSIDWLHIGVGDGRGAIFYIGFADGEGNGGNGLYVASDAWVEVGVGAHAVPWTNNATVAVFVATTVPARTAKFTFGTNLDTVARFFVASEATLQVCLGGGSGSGGGGVCVCVCVCVEATLRVGDFHRPCLFARLAPAPCTGIMHFTVVVVCVCVCGVGGWGYEHIARQVAAVPGQR